MALPSRSSSAITIPSLKPRTSKLAFNTPLTLSKLKTSTSAPPREIPARPGRLRADRPLSPRPRTRCRHAAELDLARGADSDLLARAGQERRLFVTRDKDFGGLVFVEHLGRGVISLR